MVSELTLQNLGVLHSELEIMTLIISNTRPAIPFLDIYQEEYNIQKKIRSQIFKAVHSQEPKAENKISINWLVYFQYVIHLLQRTVILP